MRFVSGKKDPDRLVQAKKSSGLRSGSSTGSVSPVVQEVTDLFVLQHLTSDPRFSKVARKFRKLKNLDEKVFEKFFHIKN